ncbi:MAG: DUF2851 family protein [Bacteroidota bacterium]
MTESFLHYLWKFRLLQPFLKSTEGNNIEIISQGILNSDEGPDFQNAKIKIGETLWAGNVEIHLKSSDWKHHAHDLNDKYKSIILHVVYENDKELDLNVPVLELKGKFDEKLLNTYEEFMQSKQWVACENMLTAVDEFHISLWLEKLCIERLENKSIQVKQILANSNSNWEEAFYIAVARALGAKVNPHPFEILARSLPLQILAKHKNNLFQIEALLFGQSGMLNDTFVDEYPNSLKVEYAFLKNKYQLLPLDKKIWKFAKIHPNNFPTLRISQFADLIYSSSHLLSKVLEANSLSSLNALFDAKASLYWDSHYVFSKQSSVKDKILGDMNKKLIIINAVIPFSFYYAICNGNAELKERMLQFLRELPPENNYLVHHWRHIGLKINDAFQSQAAIELKNNYCDQKKCLQCEIGSFLIRNG